MAEGRRRIFVSIASFRKAGLWQEGSKNSWEVVACCLFYIYVIVGNYYLLPSLWKSSHPIPGLSWVPEVCLKTNFEYLLESQTCIL